MKTSTKILFTYVAITIAALTGYMLYLHGERIPRDQYYASPFNELDTITLTDKQLTTLPTDALPDDRKSHIRFGYFPRYKLWSLHNEGDETIATICDSIHTDYDVVHLDGFIIVDEDSGEKYNTRGYYPYNLGIHPSTLGKNTKLVVEGCKGKNVLISLRFPKLKESVKRFSICQYGFHLKIDENGDSTFIEEPGYITYDAPIERYMTVQRVSEYKVDRLN